MLGIQERFRNSRGQRAIRVRATAVLLYFTPSTILFTIHFYAGEYGTRAKWWFATPPFLSSPPPLPFLSSPLPFLSLVFHFSFFVGIFVTYTSFVYAYIVTCDNVVSVPMLCKRSIDNETTLCCRSVNASLFILLAFSSIHNQ